MGTGASKDGASESLSAGSDADADLNTIIGGARIALGENPYTLLSNAFEAKSLERITDIFSRFENIRLPLQAKAIQLAAMYNFGEYYRTQDTSVIGSLEPAGVAELIELITSDDCLCALLQIDSLMVTNSVVGVHVLRALRSGQLLRATLLLCRDATGPISEFMDAIDENVFKVFTYTDFPYFDTVVGSKIAKARLAEIALEFSDMRICEFVLRWTEYHIADASFRMRCVDNEILEPVVRNFYPEQIGQQDIDTMFIKAFKEKDVTFDRAEELLNDCSSPNMQFGSALFSACANKRYDLVKLLIADPRTEVDVLDGYVLNSAVHSRDRKLVEMLVGTGKFNPSERQQKAIDAVLAQPKPKEEKRGFFMNPLTRK